MARDTSRDDAAAVFSPEPTSSAGLDPALQERVVLASATVFVAVLHAVGFAGVRMDDAYITYRYGENVARARGFVFNPGERLLGTSAPGHALIAAAFHAVVGHDRLPGAMSVLGAVAWTAQAALLYGLLRPRVGRRPAVVVALGIAAGAAQSYLFVPLETNVVAALVLGSVLLAVRGRWNLAGLALGVATVVRADALLAAGPLALLAVRDLRGGAWRPLAAFAAPVAAWTVPATAYFGAPWPHTLAVKLYASSVATYARHVVTSPWGDLFAATGKLPLGYGLVAWGLAAWGWAIAASANRRVLVLPAWAGLHVLAYLVLRPGVAFLWHLYPVALVLVSGLLCLLGWGLNRLPSAGAVAATVLTTGVFGWRTLVFSVDYDDLLWFGVRDRVDREVASYLRSAATPGDLVDSEEVGTLAYFSDLSMLDHAGLVTRADRAGLDPYDRVRAHCRALATIPRLRFLVMNEFEVAFHRCLYGQRPLVRFEARARYGTWKVWVADRAGPAISDAPAP
ncbi:MAG TPA: hypothetical protein VKU41_20745 [Polyangiaceae bacterium]|nr:hypothetical protein [Polyangiaceae bacterium]